MKIVVKNPDALKEIVLRNGYSQRSLGRAIEISEPYANQIINGTRNPGPEIAKKIVDILGVPYDDIFFIQNACKSGQKSPA